MVWLMLALPGWSQMSTAQEVALGREASAKFESAYGVVHDRALQNRVESIGARLAARCGRNDVQFVFKVANMDDFNALAFPGGYIYATKGLVKALSDEELAFVLGHEITHVSHRHAVKQISQEQLRQAGLLAVLVGLSGGSRVPGGSVQVASLIDKVVSSQYSQADESDADKGGIDMMAAAGFDPAFTVLALQTLARHTGNTPGFLNTLVGSHPLPQDRIDQAYSYIPQVAFTPPPERPNRPQAGGQLDARWEETLTRSLEQAGTPLRLDPKLRRQAHEVALRNTALPASRGLSLALPADATLPQTESLLLSQHLPDLVRRGAHRFGLSVLTRANGSRTLVVLSK